MCAKEARHYNMCQTPTGTQGTHTDRMISHRPYDYHDRAHPLIEWWTDFNQHGRTALGGKDYKIVSIDRNKAFDKIQYSFVMEDPKIILLTEISQP